MYQDHENKKIVLNLYHSHFKPDSLSHAGSAFLSHTVTPIQGCQGLVVAAEKTMGPIQTVPDTEGV